MQMQPVRLEIMRPRYRCEACGKTITPQLSFLDEKRRATRRLVGAIRERCLGMTFHALASETGLAVNTIKNTAHDLIEEMERTVCYETPVIMGVIEVCLAGQNRCVITNLTSNTIYQILESPTQDQLTQFFKNLPERERVEWVCTGVSHQFNQIFKKYLPNALHVIDKVHVAKIASEALEDERKNYQGKVTSDELPQPKKSIQWLMLKRPENLSPADKKALLVVRKTIPTLGRAYDVKEAFLRIYDEPDKELAMRAFQAWETEFPENDLLKFSRLAKTVRSHYDDIFSYWDCPGKTTNAYSVCLNGLIKLANRTGRAYSYEIIRAKTLYAKHARKVGSVNRLVTTSQDAASTKRTSETIEYGPHIPTLVEIAEAGGLD